MDSELEKLVGAGKISAAVGDKLSTLSPGSFCEHKSWGIGQVRSWDLVGGQLQIDFEGRSGHMMKLEFASKSLKLIPEEHFLAQRAGNPKALKEMAAEDPVQLVALALGSHGGRMGIDAFESVISGPVVEESEFKSWWNAAKRKLRKDRRFVVPSRRSEPLEMREEDVSHSDVLMENFQGTRDLKDKAKAANAILGQIEEFKGDAERLEPVIADINNAASKAVKMHPLRVVELIAVRDEILALAPKAATEKPGLSLAEFTQTERKHLAHIVGGLPVGRARLLLAAFPEAFGEGWHENAISLLNHVSGRGVTEIMRFLGDQGKEEAVTEFLQRGVRHRDLSPDVIAWMLRERNGAAKDAISDELPVALMNALEKNHMDEEARKASRLHDILFDDRELLGDLVRKMDMNYVRNFARRLIMTPVFEELNRRSLLARIIKVHPGVQDLITGKEEEAVDESIIVSWESLKKRKQDLEELIQKKIPENTKEISIAREYGDLRENFEFKAAKQMQAVLMRQKSEWEKELEHARGTDFADTETDSVSVGTVVSLESLDGGNAEKFALLGAWDSDPEKQILSYLSDVGKALIGRKAGEEVELPGSEEGGAPRRFKILGIEKYVDVKG